MFACAGLLMLIGLSGHRSRRENGAYCGAQLWPRIAFVIRGLAEAFDTTCNILSLLYPIRALASMKVVMPLCANSVWRKMIMRNMTVFMLESFFEYRFD